MTREDAIEEIKRWTPILLVSGQCTEKTSKAQDMAISALSGNTGEWIPTSERLPEEDGQYFVAYDREDEIIVNISYFDRHGFWIGNVLAWQPLPEPYKVERR